MNIGKPANHFFTKGCFANAIWLLIPLFFYVMSSLCGWLGIIQARLSDGLFLISWLALVVYFGIRSIRNVRSTRIMLLNLVMALICVFGVVFAHYTKPFLSAFELRIRHEYRNTAEVQTWAMAVLKTANRDDYSIDNSAYPAWMNIKHFPSPFVYIVNEEGIGDNGYVKVGWGGSFVGQWGIIVGKSNLPKKGKKWADGIYYFVSQ